jgi:hypothetical protein
MDKFREYQKQYYLKNKEIIKEKVRLFYLNNKEKLKQKSRLYSLNNKEKIKEKYKLKRLYNADKLNERSRLYRLNNKEKAKQSVRLYQEKNKSLLRYHCAKRRATKLKATPKFANLNKIKEIYKNCPKGYHVDHIIPLHGKNVCGLHVEWNLQYLNPSDNYSKSNKLIY